MNDFQLSFTTLSDCKERLSKLFTDNPKAKYRISVKKWTKKRSISMNRQQHIWYNQIAKYDDSNTWQEVKAYCKLTIGLPILLNSDEHADFYETLLAMCSFWNQSYEMKLRLMHGIEVTSKFNTAEAKEYGDNLIFHYSEFGINIGYQDK